MLTSLVCIALSLPPSQVANALASGDPLRASVETFGLATPGTLGLPRLRLSGVPVRGRPFALHVENAKPS